MDKHFMKEMGILELLMDGCKLQTLKIGTYLYDRSSIFYMTLSVPFQIHLQYILVFCRNKQNCLHTGLDFYCLICL